MNYKVDGINQISINLGKHMLMKCCANPKWAMITKLQMCACVWAGLDNLLADRFLLP